ncbi:MAG: hypothetical protein HRU46_15775 [Verrucomicrobiales bacterium]|nr:hypothetical protein [Verrucomicrobiales bacterium]
MTPSAQSSTAAPVDTGSHEEVLKLVCPQCRGTLNLLRKHIGIAGKCVHCHHPVTAVDQGNSGVQLICTKTLQAAEAAEAAAAQPSPPVEPVVEEKKAEIVPEPVAPTPPVEEPPPFEEPAPAAAPVEEQAHAMPPGFEIPQATPCVSMTGEVPDPAPEVALEPKAEEPPVEKAPEPQPAKETPAVSGDGGFGSGSALFANPGGASAKADMFKEPAQAGDLNEGWGTNTPTETHASISPFATGSAAPEEPSDSMGGSLFGESVAHSFDFEAKSAFSEPATTPASSGSSPLFAQPDEKKDDEPEEEVVLDGDGRPMRPMTEEEKEQFGKDMMKFGGYHQRSPWRTRVLKFFITVSVLCGLGYAGYYFMPDDMADKVKAKVVTFLEPGSVLADFLPFEIGTDPDTGEEGQVRIKAIDGFNQLTDDLDAYLDAADQNLNETMSEGAKMPEREKKEKMEAPQIPKLPFALPGMGGGSAEPEASE